MQNSYVGDIRDFGKYALLKHLCEGGSLKLGVNWYLVSDEQAAKENKNDGSLIKYPHYKEVDTSLYDQLKEINSNTRCVNEIERREILPSGTLFYYKTLPVGPDEFNRDEWLDESLSQRQLKESNIIFCDPDNGLEIASYSKYHPKMAHKYIFIDEVKEMYRANKSLVIYQHSTRTGTHNDQIKRRKQQLLKALRINQKELVRIVKGRGIYFLIIIRPEHNKILDERLSKLKGSKWDDILEMEDT